MNFEEGFQRVSMVYIRSVLGGDNRQRIIPELLNTY